MTLCPVALAVGCRKCPIFAVCPAKSIIGDQPPPVQAAAQAAKARPKAAAAPKVTPRKSRKRGK